MKCFPSSILSIFLFVLVSALLYSTSSSSSLKFTHQLHPIHTLPGFSNSHVKPVVLRSYGFHRTFFGHAGDAAIFSPNSASYLHHDSGLPFVTNADALVPYIFWPDHSHPSSDYGHIELNHPARVFAILWAFNIFYYPPPPNFIPTLKGAPDSWKIIGAVRTVSGISDPLGDKERWNNTGMLELPNAGLAVELPPVGSENGLSFTIPHPWTVFMNDQGVSRIALIFVPNQEVEANVDLRSFPPPDMPHHFTPFASDADFNTDQSNPHTHNLERPLPNRLCPKWLHDLYIARSPFSQLQSSESKSAKRGLSQVKRKIPDVNGRFPENLKIPKIHVPQLSRADAQPTYWRTWHPIVDPVYWCYFDHEHGSYPGQHYRPLFGYTAYNTKDPNTSSGRQDESHEGFKVLSISLEDGRLLVLTVHLHASQPRRFVTRRHTVVLAVVGANGELEMEISMKSDFGPAKAGMASGPSQPFTPVEKMIQRDVEELGIVAGRTFNVLNIDENFPDSVDTRYRFKGSIERGAESMLGGFYEQWKTTLNTCTWPRKNGEFQVDVRDPSSAARFTDGGATKENIQLMNGVGVKRMIVIQKQGIDIAEKYCMNGALERDDDGMFYTDSYMQETFSSDGDFIVRQFIKVGFEDIHFKGGTIAAVEAWDGIYERGVTGGAGLHNIERAIQRLVN